MTDAPARSREPIRVLFIVGAGRSGSTLLERVLDQVPGVTSHGELAMFWQNGVLERRRCSCGAAMPQCPFWAEVSDRAPDLVSVAVAREQVAAHAAVMRTAQLHRAVTPLGRRRLRHALPRHYLSRLDELYRAVSVTARADTVVDSSKHPVSAWLTSELSGVDATYVHLVRDPRGTAHSWSRRRLDPGAPGQEMHRYTAGNAAMQWVAWNAASAAVVRGRPHVMVRYEALVDHPVRALADLCDAVSIPRLGPDVLDDRAVHLAPGHAISGNPVRFTAGTLPIAPDDAWVRDMRPRDRRLVTTATMPGLLALGYPVRPRLAARPRPPASRRSVTLVAHTTQYRRTAVALHRSGRLERFVSVPVVARRLPRLPARCRAWNRVADRRAFPDLRGLPLRRMWFGAAVAALSRTAATRRLAPRSLTLEGRAWDLAARRAAPEPTVLHAVDGIAAGLAAAVRRRGGFVITDLRSVHPATATPSGLVEADPRHLRLRLAQYNRSDLLICNSEHTRDTFVAAGFDPARLVVVPLGADVELFRPADRRPERFTALFVGRFEGAKGSAEFAQAAARLSPSSEVVLVGTATDEHLLASVPPAVTAVGHVPQAHLPPFYRKASVLVLPSHSDGWGMVVIEAMASGVPVIVSESTGAAMAVRDGVDGFVVPTADPDALGERLLALEADPDRAHEMGRRARERSLDFSWDAYARRLDQVYSDLEASWAHEGAT